MRSLCAEPCANHEAEQCLYEDAEVEMSVEQVAEAARGGDGEHDHHAGTDRLQERHAEYDHQRELYEGRGADTERAREEAIAYAGEYAVDPELPARERRFTYGKVAFEPVSPIYLDIEQDGTREQHEGCHLREYGACHDVGDRRAEPCTDDTAEPDDGTRLYENLILAKMADRARNHRKDHGGECNAECRVNRDTESDGEQSNRHPCASCTDKSYDGAECKHRSKKHIYHDPF